MSRTRSVVLVGFEDQENLGLRYLASALNRAGHEVRIVRYQKDIRPVVEAVCRENPCVVGFSVIYEYLMNPFAALAKALKEAGVAAHFTMGGHYPSFEPEAALNSIPEMDSVVRFEGEETLVELTEALDNRTSLKNIPGLALRHSGKMIYSAERAPCKNLDDLPNPLRDGAFIKNSPVPVASILGSRGCPRNCSFCSVRAFYQANGTPGRRLRKPSNVVDEIETLHRQYGIETLLWQDDDFLGGGVRGVRWAHEIASETINRDLHKQISWKISCRSDEVSKENIKPLVHAGLSHVYLGVESGDADDLEHLDKRLSVDSHFKARDTLMKHGVSFDFGFMLLQPWSTFRSIRSNINFLRKFCSGGLAVAPFCKMLPYAGTAVRERLKEEGRLIFNPEGIDYHFLDERIDLYYGWLLAAFAYRNFGDRGTLAVLRHLLFEASRQVRRGEISQDIFLRLRQLTARSNTVAFEVLEAGLDRMEEASFRGFGDPVLKSLIDLQHSQDEQIFSELNHARISRLFLSPDEFRA